MYVAQLLDPLALSPNVEVVVSGQPEGFMSGDLTQFVGADLLEHLERHGERAAIRFGHQKMNMLWHDNVSSDAESIPNTYSLQCQLEDTPRRWTGEQRFAVIAA